MFLKKIKSLIMLMAISLSSGALAEGSYIGGNLSSLDLEGSDGGPSFKAAMVRFGTEFSDNITGEFRAGFGLGDDSFEGYDFELDHIYGAYLRVGSNNTGINPYLIVGLTQGQLSSDGESDKEDDFSFGIGVDFGSVEDGAFTLEYMSYMDKSGVELNGLSIGFLTAF